MRLKAEHCLALRQHPAPARRRRLRPKPDIAQPRLGQNAKRELDRPLHNQQVGHIRQNMLKADPRHTLARDTRGQDIVPRPKAQGRPAHQPRKHGDVEYPDGDNSVQERSRQTPP